MRLTQIAVAFDQLLNATLGGYADETLSCRCWRLRDEQPYKTLRHLVDVLLWFDKDHCQRSFENAQARKYSPDGLKNPGENRQ